MKILKSLLILILFIGCQNTFKSHEALGTWNYCTKDGNYEEYVITNEFLLIMSTARKKFFLFRNEIIDSSLVISTIPGEINLPMPTDTLVVVEKSADKVVLSSHFYSPPQRQLNKIDFDFAPIDWNSLKSWKGKIQSEFKKRAKLKKCPDLRSDEEKIIPELKMNLIGIFEEVEPIKTYPAGK